MAMPGGFIKFPTMFLQAGEPLKADICLFMPVNSKIVMFKKAGGELNLEELVTLQTPSASQQLVTSEESYRQAVKFFAQDKSDDGTPTPEAKLFATRVIDQLKETSGEVVKNILNQSS